MIGTRSRVPTETYVERELVFEDASLRRYTYRMCWEGTVLASTEVAVPRSASPADVDSAGITWLLRALSPA